jgi:hypothetical protein
MACTPSGRVRLFVLLLFEKQFFVSWHLEAFFFQSSGWCVKGEFICLPCFWMCAVNRLLR